MTQDRLKELRVEIDAIDNRILELLNRRAKAAIEVGSIKKRPSGPARRSSPCGAWATAGVTR